MIGTYTFMHGDKKIADCKFDKHGYLDSISKIYDEKLLPISVQTDYVCSLSRWITNRSLSSTRKDIAPLREFYGNDTFISEHGLSLQDQYWFANNKLNDWEKANLLENWEPEKDTVRLMLQEPYLLFGSYDMDSPNLTIPGNTTRIWHKEKDTFYLLYSNAQSEMLHYKNLPEDAIEEHIYEKRSYSIYASQIYTKVHVPISLDTELVNFYDYYKLTENPEKSNMENLKHCCTVFEIPNWLSFLNKMTQYDELIGIQDRELQDLYLLRDTKTLEIKGFAPL